MSCLSRVCKNFVFTVLASAVLASCGGGGSSADGVATRLSDGSSHAAEFGVAVLATSPADRAEHVQTSSHGADNLVTGTVLTVRFSVKMNPASVADALTLKDAFGNTVSGAVTLNATNTVATFTPASSALNTNTTYTASVSTQALSADGQALGAAVTWRFTTNDQKFTAQLPVVLGAASTFAILTKTGVTDVYASAINGDVGASPITGAAVLVTCGEVQTGIVYTVDAAGPLPCAVTDANFLTTAVLDMEAAYSDASGRNLPDFVELGAGEIGGLTLVPGLYKWGTGLLISTDVTLSGGPNDVWIFQIAGTVTQASATRINLSGGAQAKNIFWQSAGAVTLGTTAHFEGVLLAKTMVAVNTGASVTGRLLAQTAVTLQKNAVTQPAE